VTAWAGLNEFIHVYIITGECGRSWVQAPVWSDKKRL